MLHITYLRDQPRTLALLLHLLAPCAPDLVSKKEYSISMFQNPNVPLFVETRRLVIYEHTQEDTRCAVCLHPSQLLHSASSEKADARPFYS